MRLKLSIALAFLAGALLCRYWLLAPPARIAADLAQPLPVVTYWHGFGTLMWLALAGAVGAAAIAYALLLRALLAGDEPDVRRSLRETSAASALAIAAAFTFPVVFSSDVYAYAAYGAMALHGIDPYAHARLTLHDPLVTAAIWQWGNPPPVCVYGPAFVLVAKFLVGTFGALGVWWQLFALRAVASLALVACAPLAYAAFAGLAPAWRLAAAAGIALNPIAVWSVAEGHNDALMLAVVLAGAALVRHARPAAGAFVVALSALVKAPGLAAAAGLALYAWPDRPRFARVLAGAGLGTLAVTLVALPFARGVRNILVPHGHYAPQFSPQFALASLTTLPLGVALTLIGAGTLALYGARLALAGKGDGAAYLALALWLAIPNPYPWYALWIVPVAFVCAGTRASWALLLASVAIVFRYLPDATSANDAALNLLVTLGEFGIPLAAFAARAPAQSVVASSPPGNP